MDGGRRSRQSSAANPKPDVVNLLASPAFSRILPFGLFVGCLALESLLARAGLLEGFDARWLYALRAGAAALALGLLWRRYGELAALPRGGAVWGSSIAVGVAVLALWLLLDRPWATIGTPRGFDPGAADGGYDWALIAVRIAGAALVVPIMEELFWRSFVMRWIDRQDFLALAPAAVTVKALLISSVLFGFEHHLWLAGIVAGLAYGELYRRSGTLWAPVIAHAVTNALLGAWVLTTQSWHLW